MPAVRRFSAPAPIVDRRGALRHPVRLGGAIIAGARTLDVELSDISECGCRIARPADLAGGEAISLSFAGFAPFHATVIWTTAGEAGLRFDYPAHPALIAQVVAAARGRRRAPRLLASDLVRREERERLWHLQLPVAVRSAAAEPIAGVLADLSAQGCRIIARVAPSATTEVEVASPGFAPLAGRIRWRDPGAIGVEFLAPLNLATVASIAEAGSPIR